MFSPAHRPPRPRLTLRIFLFALGDIFGLTVLAIAGIWLSTGRHVVSNQFPANTAEAVAGIVGGLAVMLWSVARILGELAKQAPEMQARMEALQRAQDQS